MMLNTLDSSNDIFKLGESLAVGTAACRLPPAACFLPPAY
jgi:hypothetical protein